MSRFAWLSENAALWQLRPDIFEGLYSYLQHSHVIYFRRDGNAPEVIEIVPVLHGRMEPTQHVR